jgi:hypothetical protein
MAKAAILKTNRVSTKPVSATEPVAVAQAVIDPSIDALFEDMVNQERISYTDVNAYAGTDLDIVASRIAVEVTFALSEEIEELNVYSSEFRMSLHRLAKWILVSLFENTDKCVVVPDALPGYTAMGFKRPTFGLKGDVVGSGIPSQEAGNAERQAATMILDRFLGKAKSQVVVVECRDLLLVLFPVADMKSNLKKLGYMMRD